MENVKHSLGHESFLWDLVVAFLELILILYHRPATLRLLIRLIGVVGIICWNLASAPSLTQTMVDFSDKSKQIEVVNEGKGRRDGGKEKPPRSYRLKIKLFLALTMNFPGAFILLGSALKECCCKIRRLSGEILLIYYACPRLFCSTSICC